MFVWPKPPFQPCTAMIVEPGLRMFRASALRRPNRIRLSTCAEGPFEFSTSPREEKHIRNSYISLPLVALNPAGLRVPEWVATAVEVDLAGGLRVAGDCAS